MCSLYFVVVVCDLSSDTIFDADTPSIAMTEHQGNCCWALLCIDTLLGEPAVLLCVIQMTMQQVAIAPVNATILLTGMLTKHEPDCAALHQQRTHAPQHGHFDNTCLHVTCILKWQMIMSSC